MKLRIMKKEYIIPQTREYHVDVLLMLNTSDGEGDGNQFGNRFDDECDDEFDDKFKDVYEDEEDDYGY